MESSTRLPLHVFSKRRLGDKQFPESHTLNWSTYTLKHCQTVFAIVNEETTTIHCHTLFNYLSFPKAQNQPSPIDDKSRQTPDNSKLSLHTDNKQCDFKRE